MDYEKAYKESFEKAKERWEIGSEYDRKDMEWFFPQLVVDKDKKIREWLIDYISKCTNDYSYGGFNRDEVIDYLERQKEQKSLSTEETELNSIAFLEQMGYTCIPPGKEQKPISFNGHYNPDDYEVVMEGNATGLKQKEQKPNYCHHEVDETGWTEEYRKAYYDGWNNCNMQHSQLQAEQKPAEWSEDDEKFFKTALWHISYSVSNGKRTDEHCQTTDWLKGVKERLKSLKPQPKQEWSEEEVQKLNRISAILYEAGTIKCWYEKKRICEREEADSLCDFLKSIYSQSKQEWSEEEQKLIDEAVEYIKRYAEEAVQGGNSKLYVYGVAERLESLHPKPHTVSIRNANKFAELEYERGVKDGLNHHWKPSEAELDSLLVAKNIIRKAHYEGYADDLDTLYDDLSTLKD